MAGMAPWPNRSAARQALSPRHARRSTAILPASRRRAATPIICAMPWKSSKLLAPQPGEGGRTGRTPPEHDAGGEGGRRTLSQAHDVLAGQALPRSRRSRLPLRRLERRVGTGSAIAGAGGARPLMRSLWPVTRPRRLWPRRCARRNSIRANWRTWKSASSPLRAAARKFDMLPDDLAALRDRFAADVAAIDAGEEGTRRKKEAGPHGGGSRLSRGGFRPERGTGSDGSGPRQGRRSGIAATQTGARPFHHAHGKPILNRAIRTASTRSNSGPRPIRARARAR